MAKFATTEEYLAGVSPELRETADALCRLVRATMPTATEAIKWSMPTWSHHGPFCYVKVFRRHVNLGFWRGMTLDDPSGVIDTTGEKMGHVSFEAGAYLAEAVLVPLIRQAAALNETLGDPSRTR